jgi:hypothetical protein
MLIQKNCLVCHSQRNRTSGLSLESRDGVLTGGKRGPAIIPGKPADSRLVQAIQYTGDLKMPPAGRRQDEQIAELKHWVEIGAPWPEELGPLKHWSFQPVKHYPPPHVKNLAWVHNPIDNFILAKLEAVGLALSREADRTTLIERVSLDLTGIPPTPPEIDAFLSDKHPDAYERLVDRLLASPHHGERWARHWLDVARYEDSNGYNLDDPRDIWKYRDWLIDALNRDMPFNEFVIEQIAGDLLPGATTDQIIATGFHRNTPLNLEGGIDFEQYRVEATVDRVATTGEAFLGLTLGCARCHDHKYDPVSQREFYQFFAFYNNIDEITSEKERARAYQPLLYLSPPDEVARHDAVRAQIKVLQKELAEYEQDHTKDNIGYKERLATIKLFNQREPKIISTLVMRELPTPRETNILKGGDFLLKGDRVFPGVPRVLPPLRPNGNPNRLDLARWLVDPVNPLTPRVIMNRV